MMILSILGHALFDAVAMAWQVAWSLVLGFVISGLVQAVVSQEHMRAQLGRTTPKSLILAACYGAASSSCSYAAAAVSRTLFKRGASFIASMAFLFASTNLVVELGVVLYVLLGWQFTLAEWLGGCLLIVVMSIFIKFTYPRALIESARAHVETGSGHEHRSDPVEGVTLLARLRNPRTPVVVAQSVAMDWSMLWKDVVVGFLIAGLIAVLVPPAFWHALFVTQGLPGVRLLANTVVGALVAVLTFVCSIGNVPLAAVLWANGLSFGGVIAFLYADLIVLPLLDVYRRYYGIWPAAYLFAMFFASMVVSAIAVDGIFSALHLIPIRHSSTLSAFDHFSFNYTFWFNLIALAVVIAIVGINRRHPMDMHHCHGHD